MIRHEFYITRDSANVWYRFRLYYGIICLYIGIISCIDGGIAGCFKGLTVPSIFAFIAYLYYLKCTKKPALIFQNNSMCLYGRNYPYYKIENFWIGKDFIMRIGTVTEHWFPTKKMLYIKVKGKIMPYRFDLENNFSEKDAEEILSNLRSEDIPEKLGKTHPVIRKFQQIFFVFGCIFLFMFIGFVLEKITPI